MCSGIYNLLTLVSKAVEGVDEEGCAIKCCWLDVALWCCCWNVVCSLLLGFGSPFDGGMLVAWRMDVKQCILTQLNWKTKTSEDLGYVLNRIGPY
jgi:hypothetical protein